MHLGIDGSEWTGTRGLGRYVRCLTERLATTPDLRLTLFCPSDPGAGVPPGCAVQVDDRRRPWYNWRLPAMARQAGLDLMFFPASHAWWRGPVPAVVTVHDLALLRFAREIFRNPLEARYEQARLRWVLRNAAALVAPSEATRRDIMAMTGCDAGAVTVVPLAVADVFRRGPVIPFEEVAARYGLPERPYLLYAGALDFRKNIPLLIEALGELAKTDCEHDLLLVGASGASRRTYPDVDGLVAARGLSDRVRRLGVVPDEDLATLYAHAALFVFPSVFEGFGLPPLEAMACGAPVVCSNAASLPEVVGDAAELFDPTSVAQLLQAMQRVLTDPARAEALRARGRERAAKFTWERTAEAMLAVFRATAGSGVLKTRRIG